MARTEFQQITKELVAPIFKPENGWVVYEMPARFFDRRITVPGTPIRCIDYRFGQTEYGYDANSVPKSPSLLGAVDSVVAFYRGSAESRTASAVGRIRALGFEAADHSDYLSEDGCRFRRALFEGLFPELAPLTREESKILKSKYSVEHVTLRKATNHPDGFVLNSKPYTTVLPEDGKHYPIDIWAAQMLGMSLKRYLQVIEKCGHLLLEQNPRNLYIIKDS